ncbi:MAG: HD domain-containing phosphohydrolase [Dehalococcoidia bacterium]|nr:HD domain-containing phosphohydrolase [Dehalococcoidia bacterium]
MRTPRRSGPFGVGAKLDKLVEHIGRQLESAAEEGKSGLSESWSEEQAILEAIPDYIFRIRRDGSVSVAGGGTRRFLPANDPVPVKSGLNAAAKPGSELKTRSQDIVSRLAEELARRSRQLVAKAEETGKVQTFDLQLNQAGRTKHYEVRAAVFYRNEVLAVVRDVTARREAEADLVKLKEELERKVQEQANELNQLKEVFQGQVTLLAEEEEVLRRNFAKMERLLEDTIGAITTIVQRKDPYTAGHQQRVSQLACAIAREMGLNSEQIRVVRIASLLHDLGKVFIPAEILAKPGRLSKVEYSMVKSHPDADYQILKQIDFSCDIADIVHQHHERLDGSGYPSGLKGDAIHLEARIIAVADVVEAMVSSRPHRPASGLDAAMKEIEDGKGKLYDPAAVDACIKVFREGGFKFEVQGGESG